MKLVESNYELWGNLADAYHWAPGERGKAADAYRRAISLGVQQLKVNARDSVLVSKMAHYHAMVGDRPQALDFVRRARQIAPHDAFVLFRVAVALNQLEEPENALGTLEEARSAGFPVTLIRDTPNFNNLWSTPRFQNLIRGQ